VVTRSTFALRSLSGAIALAIALAPMPALAQNAAPPGTNGATAETEGRFFVVTLATAFKPVSPDKARSEFPAHTVYQTRAVVFGREIHLLRLGFFESFAEAAAMKDKVLKNYPSAWATAITEKEYVAATGTIPPKKVVRIAPPVPKAELPKPPAVAKPTPPPAPTAPPDTKAAQALPPPLAAPVSPAERQAQRLMEEGRAAIIREDYQGAVNAFTRLLALPPNSQSKDAQEFLGLAYERSGDAVSAKDEYDRYLRLYPEGDDAERVRQRLANLKTAPPTAMVALRQPEKKETTVTNIFGSLSQYYYHGNSKIDSQITANPLDRTTLSLTDQSALVTNLDLNARMRSPTHDNRVVVRDTYTANFLEDQDNENRLTAAYYEHKNKATDWNARFGRQPGSTGGVLERFDGIQGGFGLNPKWRLNAVTGRPVDYDIDSDRWFYGVNTDFGIFAEHWGGNLYAIQQTSDGILDRQAVGAELRYTAPRGAFFSLLDYDTSFSEVNIAMLQGNWQGRSNTSYNILLDRRKTPSLSTSNAIIGETTSSISTLLQTYSEDELRRRAEAVTADSIQYSVGLTHPFNATWQLGGDIRLSRISGIEGTDKVMASEGTGNIHTYTLQAIGTGLFAKRDVTVLSASVINGRDYNGTSYSLTNRSLFGARWTLDTTLQYYHQRDENGTERTRLTPTVRGGYKWKDNLTFEAEYGLERTDTKGPTLEETSKRDFFSLGYRWDF
jgi:tetratricopeptide (TPR) repeat protein